MDRNKSLGQLTLAGRRRRNSLDLVCVHVSRQQATLFPNPWRCRLKEISGER
jgi:hypothetical protein